MTSAERDIASMRQQIASSEALPGEEDVLRSGDTRDLLIAQMNDLVMLKEQALHTFTSELREKVDNTVTKEEYRRVTNEVEVCAIWNLYHEVVHILSVWMAPNAGQGETNVEKHLQLLKNAVEEAKALIDAKDNVIKLTNEENSLLKRQILQDKDYFNRTFELVKDRTESQTLEFENLEKKNAELEQEILALRSNTLALEEENSQLRRRMEKTKSEMGGKLQEQKIKHEQEMYIARKLAAEKEKSAATLKRNRTVGIKNY